MSTPFVGQIGLFAFNFAPTGWAFAAGQILPLSQNTALFSLLGTTYGGDGRSNFALPNLTNGRTPLQVGQGPGLTLYDLGEAGGVETVTLLLSEIPAHTQLIGTVNANATYPAPAQALLANSNSVHPYLPGTTTLNQKLSPNAISAAGGSQPHENRQPYLALNFCIALQGVYPPRT